VGGGGSDGNEVLFFVGEGADVIPDLAEHVAARS
jgi:hypothetical protein